MRIISQDGKTELPYEQVGLKMRSMGNPTIIAVSLNNKEQFWEMAYYSTEEKAKQAMDLLWNAYTFALLPLDTKLDNDDTAEQADNIKKYCYGATINKTLPMVACFQFPQDNELEALDEKQ